MTRKEAKEFLPLIQAFSEGKTIQMCSHGGRWYDLTLPDFKMGGGASSYRVKPEIKYRPFKDKDECWEEMNRHYPFGWVKYKSGDGYEIIHSVTDDKDYKLLADTYEFVDGAPFGIEE